MDTSVSTGIVMPRICVFWTARRTNAGCGGYRRSAFWALLVIEKKIPLE